SEYHYFPKTLNGEPVITPIDFAHLAGMGCCNAVYHALKTVCVLGEDWLMLFSEDIAKFKAENPNIGKSVPSMYVIKAAGVKKLMIPKRIWKITVVC
ncbi:MAG: hypothetical protein NC401_19715, partial [Ruminococcus sp.]|nr:hypothetical protein [Ruminococcus sp.]